MPRALDCLRYCPLVLGAGSGNAPGENFPALGNKAAERVGIFVIDFELLGAKPAYFLFEESLAAFPSASHPIIAVTTI